MASAGMKRRNTEDLSKVFDQMNGEKKGGSNNTNKDNGNSHHHLRRHSIADAQHQSGLENVWVGIRIRPALDSEEKSAWETDAVNEQVLKYTGECDKESQQVQWKFDRVFGEEEESTTVYNEAAYSLVESAMEGINGTVFAYGQTSSGKTHTMTAMIKMAASQIFQYIKTESKEVTVRCSSLEIYNEVVRDLLVQGHPLRVLEDSEGNSIVENLMRVQLESKADLFALMETSAQYRSVAEHNLNAASSRSHHLVRFEIEAKSEESDSRFFAHLNFVDLAGSERHKVTGTQGERLKEGCHINRSLLVLTKVIRALSDGAPHIPFRESKLTRLLQNSLGGNSRSAIICTIAPTYRYADHTRATLAFATRAKSISTYAQVNVIENNDNEILNKYKEELGTLRAELENIRANPGGENNNSDSVRAVQEKLREEALARTMAEKRTRGYERLLLTNSPLKTPRKSWSPSSCHHHGEKIVKGPGKLFGATTNNQAQTANPLRSSWGASGGLKSLLHRKDNAPSPIFDLLSPSCRKHLKKMNDRLFKDTGVEDLKENYQVLDDMHSQMGEEAEMALMALQAEVRCLKQTCVQIDDTPERIIQRLESELKKLQEERVVEQFLDSTKEETITALRNEVDRLKEDKVSRERAERALAALNARIKDMYCTEPSEEAQGGVATGNGWDPECPSPTPTIKIPHDKEEEKENIMNEEGTVFQPIRSPSSSPLLQSPCPTPTGNGASHRLDKEAILSRSPMQRSNSGPQLGRRTPLFQRSTSARMMRNHASEAKQELELLVKHMEQYKDMVARLDCQKKLLLKQVLKLEFSIEDTARDRDGYKARLARLQANIREEEREEEHRFHRNTEAHRPRPTKSRKVWDEDSPAMLMSKIISLWDQLLVPLKYRSDFYLAVDDDKEGSCIQFEYQRLQWKLMKLRKNTSGAPEGGGMLTSTAAALEKERITLARRMKRTITPAQMAELMEAYAIDPKSKGRKKQLTKKLWCCGQDEALQTLGARLIQSLMEKKSSSSLQDVLFQKS